MTLYTDNTDVDVDVDDYYDAMSSMDVDVDVMPSPVEMGGICFWMSGLYGEDRMFKVLAFYFFWKIYM